MARETVFKRRFAGHCDELKWLSCVGSEGGGGMVVEGGLIRV